MATTSVKVRGIECRCHVGVPDEERSQRQRIVLDFDLFAHMDTRGRYVDYLSVHNKAKEIAEGREFMLIEEMAEDICRWVLDEHPWLERIRVEVRKWPPSMPGVEVSTELTRSAADR